MLWVVNLQASMSGPMPVKIMMERVWVVVVGVLRGGAGGGAGSGGCGSCGCGGCSAVVLGHVRSLYLKLCLYDCV